MKLIKIIPVFLALVVLLPSCASIVSKSSYPLTIHTTPAGAKVSITDKKGMEIYSGETPTALKLKSGSGFFGKARYQVKFEKEGYETKTVPVYFKVDGWYFGNILLGGLIGMLIVDPATGAMYKLETDFLKETLTKSEGATAEASELKVMDVNDVPVQWKEHLVLLDK